MTSSPLLLGVFAALGGKGVGPWAKTARADRPMWGQAVVRETARADPPLWGQVVTDTTAHADAWGSTHLDPLTSRFASVVLGGPSDAHRYDAI